MRRLAASCALVLALAPRTSAAQAESGASTLELDRNLREYLFFASSLGLGHRRLVYAEDTVPGPGGRSELRFHLNGRARTGLDGGLGAYLGLGLIAHLPNELRADDPQATPFDDFQVTRNIRLFGAHVEYVSLDDRRRESLTIRAGRLSSYDDHHRLLLFDGASARVVVSRGIAVRAFGGRRALLDGELPDERTDLSAQLAAGGAVELDFEPLSIELGHRFEELHHPHLRIALSPSELIHTAFSASLALPPGGVAADGANGMSANLRLDGDLTTPSQATAISVALEAQLGRDYRSFGRGGSLPSVDELAAANAVPMNGSRLDRLFLGPREPSISAELLAEHWIVDFLAIQGGAYCRIPTGEEHRTNLNPANIELWLGPELALARGHRVGLEGRLALENPGDPVRTFSRSGDGERQLLALRAFARAPIPISETMELVLGADQETLVWKSEGPLAVAENQKAIASALLAALTLFDDLNVAARYGLGTLPESVSDGLDLVHEVQLWIGGAY